MKEYPTPWRRKVLTRLDALMVMEESETLDLDACMERYMEAMLERGDSGIRNILDHTINGKLGDLTNAA